MPYETSGNLRGLGCQQQTLKIGRQLHPCSGNDGSRVWVIQEVVMANLMEFRCGYMKIGWSYIGEATVFLATSGLTGLSSISKDSPGFYMILIVNKLKKNLEEGKSWIIIDILSITLAFGATNPRDRL